MNYKDDFGLLAEKMKKRAKGLEQDTFQQALERELDREAPGRIKARTQSGIDKNGKAFADYQTAYRNRKNKTGRIVRPEAKQRGETVDLTMSGAMLNAVTWGIGREPKAIILKVFVSPEQADKARRHIKGDGVPPRDFLGFTKQFIRNINRIVKEAFTNG